MTKRLLIVIKNYKVIIKLKSQTKYMKKFITSIISLSLIYVITFVIVTTVSSNADGVSFVNMTKCPSVIGSNSAGCMYGSLWCPSTNTFISQGTECSPYIYCSINGKYYYNRFDYDAGCHNRKYCDINGLIYYNQSDYNNFCKSPNINKYWCSYRNQYINNWETCTTTCTATQTWDGNKCVENTRWCPLSGTYIKQWEICTPKQEPIAVNINSGEVTYPNNNQGIVYINNDNINNKYRTVIEQEEIEIELPTDTEQEIQYVYVDEIKDENPVFEMSAPVVNTNNVYHKNKFSEEDTIYKSDKTIIYVKTNSKNKVNFNIEEDKADIKNNTKHANSAQLGTPSSQNQYIDNPATAMNNMTDKTSYKSPKNNSIFPENSKEWLMLLIVVIAIAVLAKYAVSKNKKDSH